MNIDVAATPDDENELKEFRFNFKACPDSLTLHLVRYRIHVRAGEGFPWVLNQEWTYPDLHNLSTIPQPEAPGWAIADAKSTLLQRISFK